MIFSQPDFSVQPTGSTIRPDSLLAVFQNGKVLLTNDETLPTFLQIQSLLPVHFKPFELAHTDKDSIFSPDPFLNLEIQEAAGFSYKEISIFRSLPFDTAALITTSWHLWNWYKNHLFCGKCGQPLHPSATERALQCSSCGCMVFPTISPAIIVAITCGNRILLARNANSPFANYALVAGYVEVGDTLEHAVRREVLEEVGVRICNLRYLGDQPWGISGSHMFAFHAEADDKEEIHVQKNELSDAKWFDRSELPERDHAVSIAHELIERFRKGNL